MPFPLSDARSTSPFNLIHTDVWGPSTIHTDMQVPSGYDKNVPVNTVCRLKTTLYGLKQSPRAWFGMFTKVMASLGYKQRQGDHTLFHQTLPTRGSDNFVSICG